MCFKSRPVKLLIFVSAILILAVILGHSTLVPVMSVKGLVDSADEIVVGKIERVQQTGSGENDYNGVKYPRLDYRADVNLDETIKGEPVPHKFAFPSLHRHRTRGEMWPRVIWSRTPTGSYF